jgi:hypothetical protein
VKKQAKRWRTHLPDGWLERHSWLRQIWLTD